MYLVNADDVGQEGQGLDLSSDKVSIQLLVIQLVLPESYMLGFTITTYIQSKQFHCTLNNDLCFNTISCSCGCLAKITIMTDSRTESRQTQSHTQASYLAWGETCSMIVFMMRGTNSDTTLWMFSLYSWYMSTTMIGSSASTFRDRDPRGMMVCWRNK